MVNSIPQGTGSSLSAMFRSMQKEQEEMLVQANLAQNLVFNHDSLSISAQAANASSSLVARNFVSAQQEGSSYVAALKDGFAIEKQMTMSRNEVVVAAVADVIAEAAFWYGDERMRRAKALKDSVESNEENLKKTRDELEQKAQETVATTDINGNPIEDSGKAAPRPEISGSSPGVAPKVSSAPAPTGAVSPALDVAAHAPAPSAPSIDITA